MIISKSSCAVCSRDRLGRAVTEHLAGLNDSFCGRSHTAIRIAGPRCLIHVPDYSVSEVVGTGSVT